MHVRIKFWIKSAFADSPQLVPACPVKATLENTHFIGHCLALGGGRKNTRNKLTTTNMNVVMFMIESLLPHFVLKHKQSVFLAPSFLASTQ